jgi:hypothetical protein
MKTVCISETLGSTYESTRPQNPEHHYPHRRENLKPHVFPSHVMVWRLCSRNRVIKNVGIDELLSEVIADDTKSNFYFDVVLLYLVSKNVLF